MCLKKNNFGIPLLPLKKKKKREIIASMQRNPLKMQTSGKGKKQSTMANMQTQAPRHVKDVSTSIQENDKTLKKGW